MVTKISFITGLSAETIKAFLRLGYFLLCVAFVLTMHSFNKRVSELSKIYDSLDSSARQLHEVNKDIYRGYTGEFSPAGNLQHTVRRLESLRKLTIDSGYANQSPFGRIGMTNTNELQSFRIIMGSEPTFPFVNMRDVRISGEDIFKISPSLSLGVVDKQVLINIIATNLEGDTLVKSSGGRYRNYAGVKVYRGDGFMEISDSEGNLACGIYRIADQDYLYEGYDVSRARIRIYGLTKNVDLPRNASKVEIKKAMEEAGLQGVYASRLPTRTLTAPPL